MVVWEKFKHKILLKVKSYEAIAEDSLPIYKSVKSNNLDQLFMLLMLQLKTQIQRQL